MNDDTTMVTRRLRLVGQVLVAAGAAVAVGALLPWIKATSAFGSVSRNGLDGGGDGVGVLIIGALLAFAGALVLGGRPSRHLWLGVALLGGLGLALGMANIAEAQDRTELIASEMAAADVGSGLYLVVIGAGVALASSLVLERHT